MAVGLETLINGRYLVQEELGSGSFGAVYRCRDTTLRRDVAVKVLKGRLDDPESLERFKREAILAARLSHRGITTVHDYGDYQGQPYIVNEFLNGDDLGKVLARNPSGLPVGTAVGLAAQVADALAVAHDQGVVHRDLKPQNLIVAGGQVKICDFGISKAIDATRTLTAPGSYFGTPTYSAPEQFAGKAEARSDLYSLGCVLYALLTGGPPFTGDLQTLFYQHSSVPPQPPRGIEAVPAPLSDLVLQLLAKNPGDRPAPAAHLATLLRQASLAPATVPAPATEATWFSPGPPVRTSPSPQPTRPYTGEATPLPDDGWYRQEAERLTTSETSRHAADELAAMEPRRAARILDHVGRPVNISTALAQMESQDVAAILEHLPEAKAGALLAAIDSKEAARVLEQTTPELAAALLGHFRRYAPQRVLEEMGPDPAAAVLSRTQPAWAAAVLGRMTGEKACRILEVMDERLALAIAMAMRPADRSSIRVYCQLYRQKGSPLYQLLNDAKERYKESARGAQSWLAAQAILGVLVTLTCVVLSFGAIVNWESWPWVFLLIPVGIITALGAGGCMRQMSDEADVQLSLAKSVAGTVAFLAAGAGAVLVVTDVPHVPLAVVTAVVALVGAGTAGALALLIDIFDELF